MQPKDVPYEHYEKVVDNFTKEIGKLEYKLEMAERHVLELSNIDDCF